MTDFSELRTRDVVTIVKGVANPVLVCPQMIASGWPGGLGCTWIDSPHDEFLVTVSDGTYGGFMLWGSDESSDQLIAYTRNQLTYGFATLCSGSWVIMTPTYEIFTWKARHGLAPKVPIVYHVGDRLTFSLDGKWTNTDDWTDSGDPRAPNNYYVGFVAQVPSAATNYYMTLQTSI